MFFGFRTLSGLVLVRAQAGEAHAGEAFPLRLHFAPRGRVRPGLHLRCGSTETTFALRTDAEGEVVLRLPDAPRGWFRPGRMRVFTDYPLGLFHLWSWLHPEAEFLIYPALESPTPPLPAGGGRDGERPLHGAREERSGLRDYQASDAARLIAWKASARHDTLLVRDLEQYAGAALTLDYAALAGLDNEARIRRLTAWVVAADAARRSYTLRLPLEEIGPGLGAAQRHDCLRALALLPQDGA